MCMGVCECECIRVMKFYRQPHGLIQVPVVCVCVYVYAFLDVFHICIHMYGCVCFFV